MAKKFKVTDHIPPYLDNANCQRCNRPKAADFGTEVLCVECVQRDVFEPWETFAEKRKEIKDFVLDFYGEYGDMMTKLSYDLDQKGIAAFKSNM